MKKPKPLVIVLAGQMLVLVAAIGFMATQGSAPAPHKRAKSRPEPALEEVLHAPLAKLTEETAAPAGPDGGGEWAEFPGGHPEGAAKASAAPHPKPADKLEAPSLEALIAQLVDGNARFVDGVSRQRDPVALRESMGDEERATAVVVTCTDSRVVPELMFDQPLGTFAVVRLPGAQFDDVAARAVEESVTRLHARAVLVLGHFGCHHVHQALEEKGAKSRASTLPGALSGLAHSLEGEALDEAATTASVTFAAKELRRRSKTLARSTEVTTLRVVYAPKTGKVRWLDAEPEATPAPAPRSGRR
jgi:carbonic anhydrase